MKQHWQLEFSNALMVVLISSALTTACGSKSSDGPAPPPAIPTSPAGTAQRLVTITTSMPTLTAVLGIPVTATATGKLAVNMETGQIGGSVLFSGLTSTTTGASMRVSSDDSIVVALSSPTGTTTGAWTIPAGTVLDLFKLSSLSQGGCYFRLDTQTNNLNGEKRGNIVFPNIIITTPLAALEGTGSTGTGQGSLTINLGTGALSGSLTFSGLTSNATEGHISLRSDNSSVVTLQGGAGAQAGTFTVPAGVFLGTTQLKALVNDGLYFSIHSESFQPPSGELIGNIVYPVTTIPTVSLSGLQEVPPVTGQVSSGTGSLTVSLGTGKISGSVIFNTPSIANAAYIHQGFAGENGPNIVTLQGGAPSTTGTWNVPANTFLNAERLGSLISDGLYLNIQTASHLAGEIRGQIRSVPTN
jgi:CHRD domain-containing protein